MTTTDEARVTDERRKFMEGIVNIARTERAMLLLQSYDDLSEVLIDYADRLAARDAERSELVALLDEVAYHQDDRCSSDEDDECEQDGGKCWKHRKAALLAKLRTP